MSPAGSAGADVLLIGAGRMGGALLKGWLAEKRFSSIHVIEPLPAPPLSELARAGKITLSATLAAGEHADAIVLALKPQVVKAEPMLLRDLGQLGALFVSIVAGIGTPYLQTHLGGTARVARAMPNTPGAIGKGITVLCGAGLSPADRKTTEQLMASLGETLWLGDEDLMDAVTAVSGSGPAYLFLIAEALAAAGQEQGLDKVTAELLARATVSGAGALLAADSRPASILRQEVTSPGGTTEAALKVLMGSQGLSDLMSRAIDAATRRGRELGAAADKPKGS